MTAVNRDEIIALETAYWDAVKAKDGTKTAALSGEVALVTGVHGATRIKRDEMARMTDCGDWELLSYALDRPDVWAPRPDVAIIAYTVTQRVRMNGEEHELRCADSSTWVHGPEGWKCHGHSETILDGSPAP